MPEPQHYFTDDELRRLAEGGLTQEEVASLDPEELQRIGRLHIKDAGPLAGKPTLAATERAKQVAEQPVLQKPKRTIPGPAIEEPNTIESFLKSIGDVTEGKRPLMDEDPQANFKTPSWEREVARASGQPETISNPGEALRKAQDAILAGGQPKNILTGPAVAPSHENEMVARIAGAALKDGIESVTQFVTHPMQQAAERPIEFGLNILQAALELGQTVRAVRNMGTLTKAEKVAASEATRLKAGRDWRLETAYRESLGPEGGRLFDSPELKAGLKGLRETGGRVARTFDPVRAVERVTEGFGEQRVAPEARQAFAKEFNTRLADAQEALVENRDRMSPEQYKRANGVIDDLVRKRLRVETSDSLAAGEDIARDAAKADVLEAAIDPEAEARLNAKLNDARMRRPPLPRSPEEMASIAGKSPEAEARARIATATPEEVIATHQIIENKLDDIASLKELNRSTGGDPAVTAELRALESHLQGTQDAIAEVRGTVSEEAPSFGTGDVVRHPTSGKTYTVESLDIKPGGKTIVNVMDDAGNRARFAESALEVTDEAPHVPPGIEVPRTPEEWQAFHGTIPDAAASPEELAAIAQNKAIPGADVVAPQRPAPPKGTKITTADGITYEFQSEIKGAKGKPPIRYWKATEDMPDGGGKAGSMVSEDVIRRNGLKVPGEGKSLGREEITAYSKLVSERGKPFDEQGYPASVRVRVTFSDGSTHDDIVKGLNEGHALSRAAGNWPAAERIDSLGLEAAEDLAASATRAEAPGSVSAATETAQGAVKLTDVLSTAPLGGILLAGITQDDKEDPTPKHGSPLALKSLLWAGAGGVFVYGVARAFRTPEFRTALLRFTALDKTGPADLERVFETAIAPFLPDKPANGTGATSALIGTVGGGVAGAFVGSRAGRDDLSVPGALWGAFTGAVGGAHAGPALARSFRTGRSMRDLYKLYVTEAAGMSESAVNAKHVTRVALEGRIREIKDVVTQLDSFNDSTNGAIQAYMSGNANLLTVPEKARPAAEAARRLFDGLSMDLLKSGLVKDKVLRDTIRTNIGTFVPRLLLRYELDDSRGAVESWLRGDGKGWGHLSNRDWMKGRKDIPPDILKAMGEITDNPGYLLAKRGTITAADIEQARYHRFILASPENSIPAKIVRAERRVNKIQKQFIAGGGSVSQPPQVRFYNAEGGMKAAEWQGRSYWKMPDDARYGLLRGRYVEQAVASDIKGTFETTSGLQRVFDAPVSIFKFWKAVANPASLFRNMVANTIFADVVAGVPPWRMDKWAKGAYDLKTGSKWYQRAVKDGTFGGEYTSAEIGDLLTPHIQNASSAMEVAANTSIKLANSVNETFTKWHAASEAWARMTVYRHAVEELGMGGAEAASFARRTIPDYQDVPRWIKVVRKSPFGAPFVSFSYKALPRMLESATAFGDPRKMMRFWKYPLAMAALNEYSAQKNGLLGKGQEKDIFGTFRRTFLRTLSAGNYSPDSYDTYRKYLPGHVGNMQIAIPWRDQYDRPQYLDGTYFLPWGDAGEMGKGDIAKGIGAGWLPRQLEPSNPWFQLGVAATTGKDSFTGRDIAPAGSVGLEHFAGWTQFLSRAWGPSLLNPAGYSAEALGKAFSGKFEDDPYTKSRGSAVGSEIFGGRSRPVDPRTAYRFKYFEMKKDLDANMSELRRTIPAFAKENDLTREQTKAALKSNPSNAASRALSRRLEIMDRFLEQYPPGDLPPSPEKLIKAIQAQVPK